MRSILILGGTTEARALAAALAERADLDVTLSLAGRTLAPAAMAVPVRSGGFGGVEGLRRWLVEAGTDLLIDATHPFAGQISRHAAEAARLTGITAFALCRPPWQRQPDDNWTEVADVAEAIAALGPARRRVFLALGRQEAHAADQAPQHHYLVRSVDPVMPPLDLPDCRQILARGPFTLAGELALLREAGIDAIVCKNSGGTATYAKIAAGRELGIEVMMVRRPPVANMPAVATVPEALAAIDRAIPVSPRES